MTTLCPHCASSGEVFITRLGDDAVDPHTLSRAETRRAEAGHERCPVCEGKGELTECDVCGAPCRCPEAAEVAA